MPFQTAHTQSPNVSFYSLPAPKLIIAASKPLNRVFSRKLIAACLAMTASQVHSTSLFVGYQKSAQSIVLGDQQIDFDAGGLDVFATYSLTESLSLGVSYSDLSDDQEITNNVNADLDSHTLSLFASYSFKNGYVSVSAASWEDDTLVTLPLGEVAASQQSETKSYSITAGYDWVVADWQVTLATGLHYSEWDQTSQFRPRPERPFDAFGEDGNATFISLEAGLNRFFQLAPQVALIGGVNFAWNEAIEDDNNINLAPNRPVSNNTLTRANNQLNSLVSGSESYAQISAYMSAQLGANWQLDLNLTTLAQTENSGVNWALSLGYLF